MISSLSTTDWLLIGAGVITTIVILALAYIYNRERRRAAEAIDAATGPDVALVTELPELDDAAGGDVDVDLDINAVEAIEADDEHDFDVMADGGAMIGDEARVLADEATLEPPDLGGSVLSLLKVWRHRMKAKKLARKGYVRWYKIDAQMQRPRWIKPFRNGQGQLLYYDSDGPYLFPESAMKTDARTGAYVAVHRAGDALPLDLDDPLVEGLPVDKFEETIDLSVESESPGFLAKHDINSQMILYGGIALMLVIGAIGKLMGGI